MSDAFLAILSKKLGKDIKEGSQLAEVAYSLEGKALALKGMMTLRASEFLSETDISAAEESANIALDNTLEDLANIKIENLVDKVIKSRSKGKFKLKSPGLLRDSTGKVISALNLSLLLNAVLYKYVQALMGSAGRLNNRTGRLAHSGEITNIAQVGNSKVSFMFRYQVAPYSVFEPGGRQGSINRSPKALFTDAIKAALKELLSTKGSVLEKDRIIRMVR